MTAAAGRRERRTASGERRALEEGAAIGTQAHFRYLLRLGDDNLVLAQRYAEWISNGPELEEDIALGNIGLDHLGQARALLTHAGALEGTGRTENDFAMFRTEREFTNLLLLEQPNGDFGQTMARAFFFDTFQVSLWEGLTQSSDETLAGISAKALKEARYHLRHSTMWVERLGDGTEESNRRMQQGVDTLWSFTGEMFSPDDVDHAMLQAGIGIDVESLRPAWRASIDSVFERSNLRVPEDGYQRQGGRSGTHTEALGHLLAGMQWLQRSYPGLEW